MGLHFTGSRPSTRARDYRARCEGSTAEAAQVIDAKKKPRQSEAGKWASGGNRRRQLADDGSVPSYFFPPGAFLRGFASGSSGDKVMPEDLRPDLGQSP